MTVKSTKQRVAAAAPPVARREVQELRIHHTVLRDPYAWLRDRDSAEVRSYLEAENAFTSQQMRHTEELQAELYEELLGRIQQDDSTVPTRRDDFFYYSRNVHSQQYRVYCRKRGSLDTEEEVLLDLNTLAPENRFLSLGAFAISPDHRLLAYSLNTDGSESFAIHVLDLETRQQVGDAVENTSPSLIWANDSRTFFYSVRDAAHRPYRVYRHELGSSQDDDTCIFEELDERFFVSLFKTRDQRFLGIHVESNTTTELHVLDADQPDEPFRCLVERRQGIELDVDHHGETFFLVVNEGSSSSRLIALPDDQSVAGEGFLSSHLEVVPHRKGIQLESVDCFRGHLVIQLRRDGLRRIAVWEMVQGAPLHEHEIEFEEGSYTVQVQNNPEFETDQLRFSYASLVTPRSVYDYDLKARSRELRKRSEIPSGYDSARYVSRRCHALAADGTRIPISLVHDRDLVLDGSNPALLTAYGSYGTSNEPHFVPARLSLLERGFVFAIAHVRGGGELGKGWYEDGKLLRKQNTFSDFIAAAEYLVAEGFTRSEQLAIRGGSAGGLLIGAVLNQRPDLFAAAIADVPFVDVLNTMLDPTVPLTVTEFEEWGNPREIAFFDAIRAYSPYENVADQEYPHLLVTAGLNDPRVQYWEPAKWIAKLRALRSGQRRLLLRVDMDSGHGGASGRYDAMRQEALRLAFLLASLNLAEGAPKD